MLVNSRLKAQMQLLISKTNQFDDWQSCPRMRILTTGVKYFVVCSEIIENNAIGYNL